LSEVHLFSAHDSICAECAIARPSIFHMGESVKNC